MKKTLVLLFAIAVSVGFYSCSDDDYDSRPPQFSDMTFHKKGGGTDFQVGDTIIATAQCKTKGHILLQTTYDWSSEPAAGVTHHFTRSEVYEYLPTNPTDTIVVSQKGTYKITMKGTFQTGGQKGLKTNYSESFADGNGKVSYEVYGAALFYYVVTVEKYLKIN